MATLVDAGAFVPSPADAWLLAEFVASAEQAHGPRGPIAVVTPGAAEFEIASAYHRHFAALAPPPFRTRDDAAAWRDKCLNYFQTFSKRPIPSGSR